MLGKVDAIKREFFSGGKWDKSWKNSKNWEKIEILRKMLIIWHFKAIIINKY